MHVLVAWNTRNGVPLQREALEVQSNTKLTVMNGGKLEPGATVNMLFKKEIWEARFNLFMILKRMQKKSLTEK